MSNRRSLQSPQQRIGDRRPRPGQSRHQWSIWEWMFGGFYNG
jgi:hypothetical protein